MFILQNKISKEYIHGYIRGKRIYKTDEKYGAIVYTSISEVPKEKKNTIKSRYEKIKISPANVEYAVYVDNKSKVVIDKRYEDSHLDIESLQTAKQYAIEEVNLDLKIATEQIESWKLKIKKYKIAKRKIKLIKS